MAKFQKRDRRLKLEFGRKEYFIDVTDENLKKEVQKFSEIIKENEDIDSIKSKMKNLIKVILGSNAYDEIKQEEFENREINFYELFDICEYILTEITNYTKEFGEKQLQIISKYSNRV